ncbi:23S rRNA (pseudouridine(1915)-N(3))-methyltransferase RlmH [Alloprevotella tannerae]
MKVVFIMVGKTTNKHIAQLMLEYEERIKHYLPFEIKVVDDLKDCKALSEKEQKQREGERIQRLLQAGDKIILLDERGREFRSVDFASFLQQQINAGGRRMVFIIGGPYGFSEEIYNKATFKLSLSKLTFSHQMIRLFFLEQLYRAETILHGEPYHHE